MTADQSAMMSVAHATTGAALGVILVIFVGGVLLYLWTRRSR